MKPFVLRLAAAALAALAFALVPAHALTAPMVRLHTSMGPLDLQRVSDAPLTTANFLAYVRGGGQGIAAIFERA